MAAGAGKSAAVRAALSMDGATALPAALARGSEETVWHLDRAAAEGLGTR